MASGIEGVDAHLVIQLRRRVPAVLRCAVALAALTLVTVPLSSPAASAETTIAFFTNIAGSISASSSPSIKPSTLWLTEDGSAIVEKIHWSSWGSSSAAGTGVVSVSNCNPSCATGSRTQTDVKVLLTRPSHVLGTYVYRCFRLQASNGKSDAGCLASEPTGYAYLLQKPATSTTTTTTTSPKAAAASTASEAPESIYSLSCPTAAVCQALGLGPNSSGAQRPHISLLGVFKSGSASSLESAPKDRAIDRATAVAETDVACSAEARCIAAVDGVERSGQTFNAALYTADAGKTWSVSKTPSGGLVPASGLTCPTQLVCYGLGEDHFGAGLFRTEDGGHTWSAQPITTDHLTVASTKAISCADAMHCQIVGGASHALAMRTSDGGVHWHNDKLPAAVADPQGTVLVDVICPSVKICMAEAESGSNLAVSVLRTTDGGRNWSTQTLPDRFDTPNPHVFSCPSTKVCYLVGNHSSGLPALLRTGDGGKSWQSRALPPGAPGALSCPSTAVCYYAAGVGIISRSGDGARTWTVLGTPHQPG